MSEKFDCLDCLTRAPLTVHGRCLICGSGQVVSEFAANLAPIRADEFTDRNYLGAFAVDAPGARKIHTSFDVGRH
jgi:hypothetical protein